MSEKMAPPAVLVAINTELDSVTVPEAGHDPQSTLLMAISAVGASTYPLLFLR
jgi:hypothetical protein